MSFPLAAQIKQATFLVVDDYDSMRKVTINQLRQLGANRILEAANGAEALRLLKHEQITVVFSDWNMPIMTGLELLIAVRSDPKIFSLPFIMITAEAERERVQQAINAGVSELMVKPYTAARLSEKLERAMSRRVQHPTPVAASVSHPAVQAPSSPATPPAVTPSAKVMVERPTILVVDDTPDNLHLLSQLFKEEYRVKIAHNGERALTICQNDNPPDLLLLDIMMPGMNGFEVAEKLRSHPSSEHIPIIFVTALTDDASRLRGMSLGAVDFVTKPIDPDTLHLRVKNFMRYIQLHRQVQADYDSMLDLARLKEEVEHVTRHDLKGPLAGVIGLVQDLIENSVLRTEQFDQLRMIEDAALQALNMVNLSAEIYKIETGRFELQPQSVPVAQIIRRLIAMADKVFAEKKLALSIATPDDIKDTELVASGDPMFCYSLFQNLIKNACEAAPQDSAVDITIHAGNPMKITLDNAGTIPVAIRDRFFQKFVTAGKPGGTGLGAYSAKLLAEAQNGSITIETSDPENKTRVTVAMPASAG